MRGRHLSDLVDPECAARDIELMKNHDGSVPLRSTYSLRDAKGELRCLEGMITVVVLSAFALAAFAIYAVWSNSRRPLP